MDKKANVVKLEQVAIRFSGDSGDGMQLTGTLFSNTSALVGNDLSTFPDYPAEIRAPQGTVGGVSGFQLSFGHTEVYHPGDFCDVLVAMNPAALRANAKWVKQGGTIIYDCDSFTEKWIKKAGFESDDPIKELKLEDYNIIDAPITLLTREAVKGMGLDNKSILRSKNMFALGVVYYIFNRPLDYTEKFFESKFKNKPLIIEANKRVLEAGFHYADTIEALTRTYEVAPATSIKTGKYRNVAGNQATAWGLLAAAEKAKLPLFCGSYPITPATEILQELSLRKDLGAKTFQAEDEIAGICTAIGASFAGNFAVTTTSGPGLALKSEAIGLAIMAELPLVIVNVQRGGPSTGLPTKTEQSDLMQALYGRNGESPAAVIAASSPSDCFDYAFQAGKITLEHMTPVILLTDGFLANGSEPWKIPNMSEYPEIHPPIVREVEGEYKAYARNEDDLRREWAIPGTPGLEHRIGGLEKSEKGSVSHDPLNHQKMTDIREEKVQRIQKQVPDLEVFGDKEGDVLVVGWGGTYGHLYSAVKEIRKEGKSVSLAHFNYIKPFPKNVREVFSKYKKIVVCELNLGQFANYLRMNFQEFEYSQYNKYQGLPFTIVELVEHFNKLLEE